MQLLTSWRLFLEMKTFHSKLSQHVACQPALASSLNLKLLVPQFQLHDDKYLNIFWRLQITQQPRIKVETYISIFELLNKCKFLLVPFLSGGKGQCQSLCFTIWPGISCHQRRLELVLVSGFFSKLHLNLRHYLVNFPLDSQICYLFIK